MCFKQNYFSLFLKFDAALKCRNFCFLHRLNNSQTVRLIVVNLNTNILLFDNYNTLKSVSLETEVMEAVAQFDFNARSQRELSFKKGDTLMLHNQVSNDWWKGSFLGKDGLIPDKYILLKIRYEQ